LITSAVNAITPAGGTFAVTGTLSSTGNFSLVNAGTGPRIAYTPTGGDAYSVGSAISATSDWGIYNTTDARIDFLISGSGAITMPGGGGLAVVGLTTTDTFRLNTAPTVSVATASTHKVAVNLNGSVYYLLCTT
jgi:hypothetical protein